MNISTVVHQDKCLSCGACCCICPKGAIKMEYNKNTGFFRPSISSLCIDCGLCKQICPALGQRDSSLAGSYSGIFLAYSRDPHIRRGATSGGVINALVRYLIDSDVVDAVLMSKHDSKSPIETSLVVVTKENIEELSEEPREFTSRYVTIPVLDHLRQVLMNFKRIAVVGTSCQMKALELMSNSGGGVNHIRIFLE